MRFLEKFEMCLKRLLIFCIAAPVLAYSQARPSTKFGEISREDLEMKVYPGDSAAAAVILFDVAEVVNFNKTQHRRIKILSDKGYDYATVLIPMVGNSKALLKNVKASTYNLVEGKIVETKLDTKGKFSEEFVKGINVARFTMPQVRAGSIIEYEYELGSGLNAWEFQHLIPCKWSELTFSLTAEIKLQVHLTGYLQPTVKEEKFGYCETYQCKIYHWVMKDIPAFKVEPFMSNYMNFSSQVKFDVASVSMTYGADLTHMASWADLSDLYERQQFYDKNVKESAFLKKTARDLVAGLTHPDEKVKAIYEYVKKELEWTGRNSMFSRDLKKVMEEKKGSSGDINLVLLSMLRHAGLPGDPILCSTVQHGFVRQEVPMSTQFNNVVVWSDYKGKKIILDATDKFLSIEFIPESCLNGSGYLVTENFKWVSLDVPKTKLSIILDVEPADDGDLKGKVTIAKNGFEARKTRSLISKKGQDEYLRELFRNKTVSIRDTTIGNLSKINEPLTENYEVSISEQVQAAGDVIYIDPIMFGKMTANPFVSETRNYPINFEFPQETFFMLKFKIPTGYSVDEMPQPKLAALPDNGGKFAFSVVQSGGSLVITSQMVINRVMFSQEEYPLVREFYNIIAAKHNEQIVLKRK